ncbi:hypothetical protein [Rhizobium leguminosarum]|uniref:hypothetical protein n=1 Tax=Rhizobium leguminosarum TaxID=384 RepID=UPI002E0F7EED|nr:hypothetical protein U8Q02_37955 [Rhizobium leguminosarum]
MRELSEVGSRYGAQMGRSDNVVNKDHPIKFEVARLEWVDGDYDQGGAYWGRTFEDNRTGRGSDYIFRFEGEADDEIEWMFVRAKTVAAAKAQVVATYPNATFSNAVDLDSVVAGYKEAAVFFTTFEKGGEDEEDSEEVDGADYELSEDAERHFTAECTAFVQANADLIEAAMARDMDGSLIGHNFWLSRSGSGTGFWDRGLGELGDHLHEAAKQFGEDYLYIGDDDLIHSGNEYLSAPDEEPSNETSSPAL